MAEEATRGSREPVLSPRVARWLTAIERYGIGGLFLVFAFRHGQGLALSASVGAGAADWLRDALLVLFNLFVGAMLLFGRRPVRPPRTARELFVPLLGTFLLVAFNLTRSLPGIGDQALTPAAWRATLGSLAALSTAVGYGVALWGALALGRSFGVYVAVRGVVTHGAYRWVRHPIYTGYLFVVTGLVLADPWLVTMAVAVAFVVVMVYRARLEERALAEASEAYRRYRSRVGFLLPRLR